MALLKQCFCYSLRQGSFIIGSYSLVVYCVAFAVELWWIVESLLILPAPAYTLCALYFFDFIMAAILLFGLLVRQRKYLMSWTLMTVLSFFPEAGMVLFMSLYYWPAHKFEYGIIELVYWSLRAIFNIFGAVCVCSLYLTWRDEELILGRLHDLTLANVETGSTGVGVGVLRNGNFTGTLKGNSNLAYQNYAYVDSSPGLTDNLNYKNSNAFHSKKSNLSGSLKQRRFFIRQQNNKYNYYYYYCLHKSRLCAQCQTIYSNNDSLRRNRKVISSLPSLFTSDILPFPTSKPATSCCHAARGARDHLLYHRSFVLKCSNCRLANILGNNGYGQDGLLTVACKGCGSNASCSANINANHQKIIREEQPASSHHHRRHSICCNHFELIPEHAPTIGGWHSSFRRQQNPPQHPLKNSEKTSVLTVASLPIQQTDENLKQVASTTGLKDKEQAYQSSNSNLSKAAEPHGHGKHIVPKIEIVICTEVHGSIETTVIKQPHKQPNERHRRCCKNSKAYQCNNQFAPLRLNYFRRAVSDSPKVFMMAERFDESSSDQQSSVNSMRADAGSVDSETSMITDAIKRRKLTYKKGHNEGRHNRSYRHSASGGGGGEEGKAFRIFNYLTSMATCCLPRSESSSLLSIASSQSCDRDSFGDGMSPLGSPRGLFNTRSFTLNSETLGNHHAPLAMKSEFNPATLFDPAYRKSRISELGIAGIGLEPPGQIPIGTFNRINRSRSLWNVSNEDYWNRPPPSRPVSMGYVNHIHQLDQMSAHKECCPSMANNNSNATINLNKQMILKCYGGCSQGYRNPIHGSNTSVATINRHHAMTQTGLNPYDSCEGIIREQEHRRNWLATSQRRAQSVDGLNHHFYHRLHGRNAFSYHNAHPSVHGIISGADHHHSQDWSKSSICPDEPLDDIRNYHDIAL